MISDRAAGGEGSGGRRVGEGREGAERIEEERNQRRLSAYEVGIVGWRRPVLSSISLRIIRRGPRILDGGSRCKRARSETADVFSKWRRISR